MKYYLIEKDEKIVDTPQLVNWYSKLNVENVKMGSYHKINNRLVLEMKDNKDVYFPEVLFHPCFMISKKIKEIVKSKPHRTFLLDDRLRPDHPSG